MAKRREDLSPHYKANDEGGFGNPPVKNQFRGKPGPGRPKAGITFQEAIRQLLKLEVAVTADGNRLKMPLSEALMQRLAKEMLTGPMRALELGLLWMEKYGPQPQELKKVNYDFKDFSEDEKRLYRSFLMRAVAASEGGISQDHSGRNVCGTWQVYMRDDGFIGLERLD